MTFQSGMPGRYEQKRQAGRSLRITDVALAAKDAMRPRTLALGADNERRNGQVIFAAIWLKQP